MDASSGYTKKISSPSRAGVSIARIAQRRTGRRRRPATAVAVTLRTRRQGDLVVDVLVDALEPGREVAHVARLVLVPEVLEGLLVAGADRARRCGAGVRARRDVDEGLVLRA